LTFDFDQVVITFSLFAETHGLETWLQVHWKHNAASYASTIMDKSSSSMSKEICRNFYLGFAIFRNPELQLSVIVGENGTLVATPFVRT
jgi:hypothetical protein